MATTLSEVRDQLAAVGARAAALRTEDAELQTQVAAVEAELTRALVEQASDAKVKSIRTRIRTLRDQRAGIPGAIAELEREAASLRTQYDEAEREQVRRRAEESYQEAASAAIALKRELQAFLRDRFTPAHAHVEEALEAAWNARRTAEACGAVLSRSLANVWDVEGAYGLHHAGPYGVGGGLLAQLLDFAEDGPEIRRAREAGRMAEYHDAERRRQEETERALAAAHAWGSLPVEERNRQIMAGGNQPREIPLGIPSKAQPRT
jgi:hypothetical protein